MVFKKKKKKKKKKRDENWNKNIKWVCTACPSKSQDILEISETCTGAAKLKVLNKKGHQLNVS